MGNLNTAGVSADVRTRMLNYLNYVPSAAWLAGKEPSHGPILDDPTLGYGDNVNDYDIGLTVAKRILNKKNSLAGQQFTTLNQLNGIDYLGQDKFDDLVYTFSRYWELFLNVNLFAQTQWFYCGAASAQMILDYVNNWGGNPQLTQLNLYNTIQNFKTDNNFYTDPDGLCGCLNQESPAANQWLVHSGNSVDETTRKLLVTMETYDAPPAALIFDGDHWVVVSGTTATEGPSMNKPSFIVYTIQVQDPGGGGQTRDIEYQNWITNFFTPNTWGATFNNRYVGVYDPKVKAKKKVSFIPQNLKTKGKRMISLKDAQKYAQESLVDYHLTSQKVYKKALRGAKVGTPIPVKNLRVKSKPFYYLVPFEKNNRTSLVVMINAYYGNYLGSSVVDKPKGYLAVKERAATNRVVKALKARRKKVDKAHLVWKPSVLSWDPFEPVWKIKLNGRVRYVNQQKKVASQMKRARMGGM